MDFLAAKSSTRDCSPPEGRRPLRLEVAGPPARFLRGVPSSVCHAPKQPTDTSKVWGGGEGEKHDHWQPELLSNACVAEQALDDILKAMPLAMAQLLVQHCKRSYVANNANFMSRSKAFDHMCLLLSGGWLANFWWTLMRDRCILLATTRRLPATS